MNILYIMDPLDNIHPQKDTTYLLICETLRRKMKPYFCDRMDLSFRDGAVFAKCQEIFQFSSSLTNSEELGFSLGKTQSLSFDQFGMVFMRTDPPFDLHYLTATYLLDLGQKQTFVINNPSGLQKCNEKLYSLHFFPEVCPPSLVSCQPEEIKVFLKDLGGKGILKPIYRSGGEGVFLLDEKDSNVNVILESATSNGMEAVTVQQYLPEVRQGDKRVILIGGEPIGATLRISQSQDHRSNIHVGGACFETELTPRDREICEFIKPRLLEDGLYLVGLDIIGAFLTEINFTSPTGFQEINRLQGLKDDQTMEAITFDFLLAKRDQVLRAGKTVS